MILGTVPLAGPVHAQDPDDETPRQESRTQESHADRTSPGKRDRHPVRTLQEFIPSEEISADKPISFPVDI